MPKAAQAADPDAPRLELVEAENAWGGPTYAYRGGVIRCMRRGQVCMLEMPDHPQHGRTFGVPGTITALVDCWLDLGELPAPYGRVKLGPTANG